RVRVGVVREGRVTAGDVLVVRGVGVVERRGGRGAVLADRDRRRDRVGVEDHVHRRVVALADPDLDGDGPAAGIEQGVAGPGGDAEVAGRGVVHGPAVGQDAGGVGDGHLVALGRRVHVASLLGDGAALGGDHARLLDGAGRRTPTAPPLVWTGAATVAV